MRSENRRRDLQEKVQYLWASSKGAVTSGPEGLRLGEEFLESRSKHVDRAAWRAHDLHLKDTVRQIGEGPGDSPWLRCPLSHISLPAVSYCGRSLLHPTRESVEEFPLGQGMSSGQTGLVKVAKVSVGANRTYPPQVGTTAIIGSRLPTDDTSSVQLLMCPTPCDPMNHSMPGLLVHHQLPESTQIHVH